MSRYHNRTRAAPSIPARLFAEWKPHLVPLYYLLRLSDLAREGMEHSGSYRFADHIYGNMASGRLGMGWIIDRILLSLSSARSLRERYLQAKLAIRSRVEAGGEVRVLSVPCGLARELFESYGELDAPQRARLRCFGLDLDGDLVRQLRERVTREGLPFHFVHGDAFEAEAYPPGHFDLIISMGFTEFLDDEGAVRHYAILRDRLAPSGTLFASGMRRHRISDFLLRHMADLHTHYRDAHQIESLCRAAGFRSVRNRTFGLQTIAFATLSA